MKKLAVLLLLIVAVSSAFSQGGGPRPKFIIQPTALNFGTNVIVGDSLDRLFTLRTDTSSAADVTVSITNPNSSVYRIVGSTSFTVERGTTDTVRLRFIPIAGLQYRDTIWVTHNGDTTFPNPKSPARITMNGIAVQPDTFAHVSVSPTSLNFNFLQVGQTATRVIAITNTSFIQKQLTGSSALAKSPSQYSITSSGIFSVAKGGVDSLVLSFTPTVAGLLRDTLIITSNAGSTGTTITKVPLSGFAIGVDTLPRMTVTLPQGSFNTVNYGQVSVGKSLERTIKLFNTSDSAIKIHLTGSSALWKAAQYSIISGGSSFDLARGDSQLVTIKFTPDSILTRRDTLIITNNSSNPTIKIPLTGQGVAPSSFPKIQFLGLGGQGNRLSFGQTDTIGVPIKRTFTIRNNNTDIFTTLTGTVGTPAKPQFVVTSGAGPFSLDSSLSTIVEVTLTATDIGPITDTLLVTSNDPTRPSFTVLLTGNGILPSSSGPDTNARITINRNIFVFGTVAKGASEQMLTYRVTNSSTNNKTLVYTITSPSSPYRLASGGGTFQLDSGRNRFDTIFFNTQTIGLFSDSLVITSNTSDQTKRMVIPINGTIQGSGSVPESRLIARTSLYPNPTSAKATLQFDLEKMVTISAILFDIKGTAIQRFDAAIYPQGTHRLEIDGTSLLNGTYYLRLESTDGVKAIPVLITK